MKTKIDTTFQTMQRDLFESGIAAQIGMSAFGLWQAIKSHADFDTGEAEPGIRRLAEMTGMGKSTVSECVKILEKHKMLRVITKGKGKSGTLYVARERLDIRLGARVLCTIVVDYIPIRMGERLKAISEAVNDRGRVDAEALTNCEIIPGDGFRWDSNEGVLKAALPTPELIPPPDEIDEDFAHPAVRRLMDTRRRIAAAPKDIEEI
jgi:hypothetical protein